jgi:N-acetylglucosamine-6-sulfatase
MPLLRRKMFFLFLFAFLLVGCSNNAAPQNTTTTPVATMSPTIFEVKVDQGASAERFKDTRPNIIFILTDDQPFHTLAYMPTVKKELVANGVNFTSGFVTTPLCCPSRASILTGEYAHNHKDYTDEYPVGGAPKFNDTSTFATWLQAAGYTNAYFGKYLNEYDGLQPPGRVPPGWADWKAFLGREPISGYYFNFTFSENGKEVSYPKNKDNYSADVITRAAVDFINRSKDQPFFLMLGYYNPHSNYISAPRHKDTFRSGSGWEWTPHRPPNFMEADVSDKPAYMRALVPTPKETVDVAEIQILRSLLSVDDGVASILNILKQTGLENNTIIVYLTDNGLTIGEHNFGLDKDCPYDECAHVPFIVYAPWLYPARTDNSLVANIDLAPTFAEWTGAKCPNTVNGTSLVPLLKTPGLAWRDELMLEHWRTLKGVGSLIPNWNAVRTTEWKYVELETGECELYDLKGDPYELQNLCNKPEYAKTQAALKQRLEVLKKQ